MLDKTNVRERTTEQCTILIVFQSRWNIIIYSQKKLETHEGKAATVKDNSKKFTLSPYGGGQLRMIVCNVAVQLYNL